MKRKPPIGSVWRILAHGYGEHRGKSYVVRSYNSPGVSSVPFGTVFDELVIAGVLHVEQMSTNHWWLNAGDLHVDIVIKRGGPVVTWWEDKGW